MRSSITPALIPAVTVTPTPFLPPSICFLPSLWCRSLRIQIQHRGVQSPALHLRSKDVRGNSHRNHFKEFLIPLVILQQKLRTLRGGRGDLHWGRRGNQLSAYWRGAGDATYKGDRKGKGKRVEENQRLTGREMRVKNGRERGS